MMTDILNSALAFHKIQKKAQLPVEILKAHQWQCVKETLSHACSVIPYYKETFHNAGIDHRDIRSWEDFQKIPILTKKEKRLHSPDSFLPENIDKRNVWKTQTTGSSGIPTTVYRNSESAAWDRALIHYCFSVLGIKPFHRFCQLSTVMPEKSNPPGPLARMGLKRSITVNLRQTDEEILRELKTLKPDAVFTFPSVLLRLAETLKARNESLNVRWLISQGEVLPESWRQEIQRAFQAPLYHTYGATELARIGFECRLQRGYHLIPDAAVVEVHAENGPAPLGQEGELIVTNLNNFCSPLIRYQIGDRGVLSSTPCPCGNTFPILERVTGRSDDFLILTSGTRVSARAVTHMQFEGILQYKIIQKSISHLQVLVIPSPSFSESTIREIKKVLSHAFLGEPMHIEIIKTESLPVSRTGKLQLVAREF